MKPLLIALTMACAALTACSSTPATRYHSLLASDAAQPEVVNREPLPLELAAVSVPSAVDQQQWVVRMPDDSLRILEREQWVSPLRDELRAALFERLAQRYGAVDVRVAPAQEALRLTVDIQRFESRAAQEVWIEAVWTINATRRRIAPLVCRSSVREPVQGDVTALAAAHRRAVQALADQIGPRLLTLQRSASAPCP